MSRALSSELLKLRTTRTFFALVGAVLGLVGLILAIATATSTYGPGSDPVEDAGGIAGMAQLFALVLGILTITGEYRHGTITSTLLVTPNRLRLLGAKLAVALGAGIVLGLATTALALAITQGVLGARDVETGLGSGDAVRLLVGNALACGLFAALGVGVGALVPNQVGAIVGSLAWIFVVEGLISLVGSLSDLIETYGVNGVSTALSGVGDSGDLSQAAGGLLMLAYAAALALAGGVALRRRDVG